MDQQGMQCPKCGSTVFHDTPRCLGCAMLRPAGGWNADPDAPPDAVTIKLREKAKAQEAHRQQDSPSEQSATDQRFIEPRTLGEVVVTDIRMPFGSMVVFMIKWAIASIPATIILSLLLFAIFLLLASVVGGLGNLLR